MKKCQNCGCTITDEPKETESPEAEKKLGDVAAMYFDEEAEDSDDDDEG